MIIGKPAQIAKPSYGLFGGLPPAVDDKTIGSRNPSTMRKEAVQGVCQSPVPRLKRAVPII